MKYDRSNLPAGPMLFFWDETGAVDEGCLCQWHHCEFEADGVRYNTAEQYMMAHKALLFGDDFVFRAILDTDEPDQQKALGRMVSGFVPEVWEANKYAIVRDGNLAKFSQNPDLREYLLGTGDAVLVEASPDDDIWGIGLDAEDPRAGDPTQWQGENLLGFALMEVRDLLREGGKAR